MKKYLPGLILLAALLCLSSTSLRAQGSGRNLFPSEEAPAQGLVPSGNAPVPSQAFAGEASAPSPAPCVKPGIEVLEQQGFAPLKGNA